MNWVFVIGSMQVKRGLPISRGLFRGPIISCSKDGEMSDTVQNAELGPNSVNSAEEQHDTVQRTEEGYKSVKKADEWLDTDENCEGANCTGQTKESTDTS
jgi:hypothetical protein